MKLARLSIVALAVILASCSTAGSGAVPGLRAQPDILRMDQLRGAATGDAYQLLRSQRPLWLQSRGIDGDITSEVVVYYNHLRWGSARSLERIPLSEIESIRYLDGRSATTIYGPGHGNGAIVVQTRGSMG